MKVGLEIHQRLDTKKLFCNCSSELAEGESLLVFHRRLHPVVSELGEIDEASRAEFAKGRLFEYQTFEANNCLVEMDEEPPHELRKETIFATLEIAQHLNAEPVDEVHVMRKIVIDGSNTAGFQRTGIVAMNGRLDSSKGKIGIPLIAIEEESAGIVSVAGGKATYRLDRLGIPLVEISTTPDIKDGEHLKEVAEKIGTLLRLTGKVARGIGTIRQDVNISTEEGARVEIKGAQELRMLPTLVDYEVKRQNELVSIIKELKKRKFGWKVSAKPVKVNDILKDSEGKLIKKAFSYGEEAVALLLPKHEGILGKELVPGRRYGTEFSDYAKRAGVKGIIHSDEKLEKYGITQDHQGKISERLSLKEGDAFVLVLAPEEKAFAALSHVVERAEMDYVPEETRKAHSDGSSSYMRPLPGRARMYPETDIPPIPVTAELMKKIKAGESLAEKKARLQKILNKEMAGRMLKSRHLKLFEKYVDAGIEPMLAATTLENTLVSLRREGVKVENVEKLLDEVFENYKKGLFAKAAIPEVIKGVAAGKSVKETVKEQKLGKLTGKELEKVAKEENYDVKKIMAKHRLSIDPKELIQIIKKKKS